MTFHVLPGDSLAEPFRAAAIDGETIVFRECMIVGDLTGETLDAFFERRALFISLEYGEDPIDYQETVADEISRLLELPDEAEVNLWFEFELFCQVNMWFCIDLLKNANVRIYRVAPVNLSPDDVWQGFGKHSPEELREAFDSRVELTPEDIDTGSRLWAAYKDRVASALNKLGEYRSPSFPFLREIAAAAADAESRPGAIIRELMAEGNKTIEDLFPEFQKRAGIYGLGDLQVERLMTRAANENVRIEK